mgnify:FL=1
MNGFDYTRIKNLDYFDSRDVITRRNEIDTRINEADETFPGDIVELRLERLVLWTILEDLTDHFPPSPYTDVRTDENCGVSGFADHYATEYAEELASDIGAIDQDAGWPLSHIDWEGAAEDLKDDYTEVEILGATFYLRD